ncbi:hypothetical protein ACFJGW_10345 [Burkholderiaceae bacterium UC74_6]
MTAKDGDDEVRLQACIDRLAPKIQKLGRAVRAAVRKRFPTANELGYDYGDFVVIGYSPNDKGIDAVVAIALRATGVFLYFSQGPQLPDPKQMLRGTGKQVRFIELADAKQLADPDVEALITATIAQARVPLAAQGKGRLIFKASGAKKNRRSAQKAKA